MTPAQEHARLRALEAHQILDTAPEPAFDRVVELAADLFDAPIALVSLVDAERQWFKARVGLEISSTPRAWSLCAHAVERGAGAVMVVEDAAADVRFAANPLVTGAPHIRFYAGATLADRDGHVLGALCVIDTKARGPLSENETSRLKSLAAMVLDIIDLRRGGRRAHEKKQLLDLAEHMSGVGHWRMDRFDGKLEWSDECARIHGVTPEELNDGRYPPESFYGVQGTNEVRATVAEALRTGKGYEIELPLIRADGQHRIIMCKTDSMRDETGRVVTLHGVFQDVTEQRQAISRLERGRARYKLLADNVADVIARIRLDGHSSYISPAVFNLLGYHPDEMAGHLAQDFVYPEDLPLITNVLADMAAGAEARTVQHRVSHKAGHAIWVETHFKLIERTDDGPLEMVAVIRDITERKALEARLREAQADAEAAAAAKGEFLANMSHELRTPLTSIVGFIQLASEQPDLAALTRTYVDRVGEASRALLCTVNDILDFSKLEAGQVSFSPAPVSLAALSQGTLALFTPQAAARDLHLVLESDADPGLVIEVDADRIRQILLNLMGNAVKFTETGSVTLRTRYIAAAERLEVEVIDTGGGIPAEMQDRLFQRFSQVDGALTRNRGGTGLGLAICKGLVEAMGGEIGVESAEGQGSRFWFWTPAPAASTGASDAAEPAEDTPLMAGSRLLIVDDHPANRELARLFLAGVGAEVVEAEDGEDAVRAAAGEVFDLILMDLRMPRLDGPGALRRIRDGGGPNARTPVIAFTADAGGDLAERLAAMGFQGVVAKPLDPRTLITAVARGVAAGPVGTLTAAA